MKADKLAIVGGLWALVGAFGLWRGAEQLWGAEDPSSHASAVGIILANAAALAGGVGAVARRRWAVRLLETLAWSSAVLMVVILVGGAAGWVLMQPRPLDSGKVMAVLGEASAYLAFGSAVFGLTIHLLRRSRVNVRLK